MKVGKSFVFDSKMGIRKFWSVALPFGKVACAGVLGGILSGIGGLSSNFYRILSADRRLNRKTKLDTRAVSKVLY